MASQETHVSDGQNQDLSTGARTSPIRLGDAAVRPAEIDHAGNLDDSPDAASINSDTRTQSPLQPTSRDDGMSQLRQLPHLPTGPIRDLALEGLRPEVAVNKDETQITGSTEEPPGNPTIKAGAGTAPAAPPAGATEIVRVTETSQVGVTQNRAVEAPRNADPGKRGRSDAGTHLASVERQGGQITLGASVVDEPFSQVASEEIVEVSAGVQSLPGGDLKKPEVDGAARVSDLNHTEAGVSQVAIVDGHTDGLSSSVIGPTSTSQIPPEEDRQDIVTVTLGRTPHEIALFAPKNERLQTIDLRNVNLRRAINERELLEPPAEFSGLTPIEINSRIAAERTKKKETGQESDLLIRYERFVSDLRTLRHTQHQQIAENYNRGGFQDPQHAMIAYESSVSSNQSVQQQFLIRLSDFAPGEAVNYIRESQVALTHEEFIEAVRAFIDKRPAELIYGLLPYAKAALSPDEIRAFLDRGRIEQPSGFITSQDNVRAYYTADEFKEIVFQTLLQKDQEPIRYSLLQYPEIVGILDQAQLKTILLHHAINDPFNFFENTYYRVDQVRSYITSGTLTEEEIRGAILSAIDNETIEASGIANLYADYFMDKPEEAVKYRQAIVRALIRETNPVPFIAINTVRVFLTEEDKTQVVRTILQRDPKMLVAENRYTRQYATTELIRTALIELINMRYSTLFGKNLRTDLIFDSTLLTPDEQNDFLRIVIDEFPESAIYYIDKCIKCIPVEERESVVRKIVFRIPPSIALEKAKQWLPYITTDPIKQKELLSEIISSSTSFDFVSAFFLGSNKGYNAFLDTIFTVDEIKAHILKITKKLNGIETFGYDTFKHILELLGDKDSVKQFVGELLVTNPLTIIYDMDDLYDYLTNREIEEVLDIISQTPKGIEQCIYFLDKWCDQVTKPYVRRFLQLHQIEFAGDILEKINTWWGEFFTETKGKRFSESLISANPITPLRFPSDFDQALPNLLANDIIEAALADKERISFAPRILTEFFNRAKHNPDILEKNALMTHMAQVYKYIGIIKANNMTEVFRHLQAASKIQELELLEIVACAAMVGKKNPDKSTRSDYLGHTLEDAKRALFLELFDRFNTTETPTEEEIQRFLQTMGSPAPFFLYLLQFEGSKEHIQMLEAMATWIMKGNFNEWKFGPQTSENLELLKERGLLPDITEEQFEIWQEDNDLSLNESLTSDAESTIHAIQQIIHENRQHIPKEILIDESTDFESELSQIRTELRIQGALLASARLDLKHAQSEANTDAQLAISQTCQKAQEQIQILNARTTLIRILNLMPEEVISGTFLEGDQRQRGKKITKVLNELISLFAPGDRFIIGRINTYLSEFHEQTGEAQNLKASDTSDPKVLIEIGAKPADSCQHYANGEANECLLGYSEPNTKIITLTNERGNLVARAVLRLMMSDKGVPSLHIERVYSAVASPVVTKIMYLLAENKAKKMGINLYRSREAQNAEGEIIDADPVEGFIFMPVDTKLNVKEVRAPQRYVDSVTDDVSYVRNGGFTLTKLQLVQSEDLNTAA